MILTHIHNLIVKNNSYTYNIEIYDDIVDGWLEYEFRKIHDPTYPARLRAFTTDLAVAYGLRGSYVADCMFAFRRSTRNSPLHGEISLRRLAKSKSRADRSLIALAMIDWSSPTESLRILSRNCRFL